MSVDEFRAQFAEAAGLPTSEPAEEEAAVEETAPVEPEPAQSEQEETSEQAPPERGRLLGTKYENVEELERAYWEMQDVLTRQGAELGELRQLTQEVGLLREQMAAPQQQPPQYNADELDEWMAINPHQIPALAQQGLDTQDGALYARAINAWSELDRVGAMDFHARAVSKAEISQLREELAPALQGMAQRQTSDQFEEAFNTKTAEHPDFAQVIGSITEQTLDSFPREILGALQTGDQASKERVLETLYRWVKAEQAGDLNVAATEAARQSAEDIRQERQQAAVATPGTSQTREPTTGVGAFREAFRNSDEFRKHT
jgi:hypothetical protein